MVRGAPAPEITCSPISILMLVNIFEFLMDLSSTIIYSGYRWSLHLNPSPEDSREDANLIHCPYHSFSWMAV